MSSSILDTIMNQTNAEKIGRLDVADMITRLFATLNDRERDILKRRFGLSQPKKATLEEIGQTHNLTRERIRQLETGGINKIKKLEEIAEIVGDLRTLVNQLLEEHGGLMEKEYLFDILLLLALDPHHKTTAHDETMYRNHFNFILSKVLDGDFSEVMDSKHFNPSFRLHYQELDHLEEVTEELIRKIKAAKKLFLTKELMEAAQELEAYKKHAGKLKSKDGLDLTKALESVLPTHEAELANEEKPLYSLIRAITDLEQNKFGHWGHAASREINPKTINDKIYLVLKDNGKPMHYEEISKKINTTGFDGKAVNTATVHNELILDEKYVLVGRGLYALKEWGYTKGTVADIISSILEKSKTPLTKKEIAEKVMEQRLVKKTTIDLALMNKKRFERVPGNKYQLVK